MVHQHSLCAPVPGRADGVRDAVGLASTQRVAGMRRESHPRCRLAPALGEPVVAVDLGRPGPAPCQRGHQPGRVVRRRGDDHLGEATLAPAGRHLEAPNREYVSPASQARPDAGYAFAAVRLPRRAWDRVADHRRRPEALAQGRSVGRQVYARHPFRVGRQVEQPTPVGGGPRDVL